MSKPECKECTCKEWEKGMKQIAAAQFLAANHYMQYTGGVFRFCPWCGKYLLDAAMYYDKENCSWHQQ